MALASCRECGQQVSTEANTCPHCGTGDPTGKERQKKKHTTQGCLGCLGVLGVLVILAIFFGDSGTSPSRRAEEREAGAYTTCQNAVKARLQAPGTAKFPWGYTGYIDNLGGGTYRVRRYVDAYNTFGTKVRTNFTCTVQLSGGLWRLINLDMKPR